MLYQTTFPSDAPVRGHGPSGAAVLLSSFSLLISHMWPLSHAHLPLLFPIPTTAITIHSCPTSLPTSSHSHSVYTYLLSVYEYTHLLTFNFLDPYFLFNWCDPFTLSLPHSLAPLSSPSDSLTLLPLLSHMPTAVLGPSSEKHCQSGNLLRWLKDNWGKGRGADAWTLGMRRPGGQPGFPRPLWQEGVGLN